MERGRGGRETQGRAARPRSRVLDSARAGPERGHPARPRFCRKAVCRARHGRGHERALGLGKGRAIQATRACHAVDARGRARSEEHTSELQSLMRISYAVFCLKKNKQQVKVK